LQKPSRILVVDDEENLRNILVFQLRGEGFEARGVSRGDEALPAALSWKPQLVLLDLMMPGMDGIELRAQQLGDPSLATIPTVILTGGSLNVQDRGRLGDVEILIKPVTLPELLDCLARHRSNW
jgi:two-component system phosphate regulon response regulator PhoB